MSCFSKCGLRVNHYDETIQDQPMDEGLPAALEVPVLQTHERVGLHGGPDGKGRPHLPLPIVQTEYRGANGLCLLQQIGLPGADREGRVLQRMRQVPI